MNEPKPRGRQRSLEAEAAVLAAVMELLKNKPLREVTADAIAQRAGVSKATLYKWWPNKNIIALDACLSRMNLRVTIPDTGSAYEDFALQLKDVIQFYTSPDGGLFRQFIAEGQSDPEFLTLFRDRFVQARRDAVRAIWDRGVTRGEIRDDIDSDVGLDLIFGPMVSRLLTGHAPLNDAQADAMMNVAFRAVRTTH